MKCKCLDSETQMKYLLLQIGLTKVSEDWVDKDEQALSLIGLNLDPTLIHYIKGIHTTRYAWNELDQVFGA